MKTKHIASIYDAKLLTISCNRTAALNVVCAPIWEDCPFFFVIKTCTGCLPVVVGYSNYSWINVYYYLDVNVIERKKQNKSEPILKNDKYNWTLYKIVIFVIGPSIDRNLYSNREMNLFID